MPDPRRQPVHFEDTDLFKKWLERKGYNWPRLNMWERDRVRAENMREMLTRQRTNKIEHEGRYCGDQMCCWGPAGKKVPKPKKEGSKDA